MGRLNNDEQFKFLISCIRWSNNGKVDFTEVANECKIVSKGAAAKRYERMMKAHGIHQPTNTARDTAVPPMRPKEKDATTESGKKSSSSSTKKRKIDEFDNANLTPVKQEASSEQIKEEDEDPVLKFTKSEASNYPWVPFKTFAELEAVKNAQQGLDAQAAADTQAMHESTFNDYVVDGTFGTAVTDNAVTKDNGVTDNELLGQPPTDPYSSH